MYKEVLRSIEGISVFPVIGIVIFFSFFIGLLVYVWTMKKEEIDHAENIPLQDTNQDLSTLKSPSDDKTHIH